MKMTEIISTVNNFLELNKSRIIIAEVLTSEGIERPKINSNFKPKMEYDEDYDEDILILMHSEDLSHNNCYPVIDGEVKLKENEDLGYLVPYLVSPSKEQFLGIKYYIGDIRIHRTDSYLVIHNGLQYLLKLHVFDKPEK